VADRGGLEGAQAVIIRPADEADFEALVDLDLASAEHHAKLDPGFYQVPPRPDVAAFLARRLADPDREMFVAEVDGEVVGMVDVTAQEPPDPGSIIRPIPSVDIGISVADAWRRRGVGRALMEAAEARARARGASLVVLDMSAANRDALAFYHELGYREFGLFLRREILSDPEPGRRATRAGGQSSGTGRRR
jgi:ribosomal protein S18 acetylase RimI-like enzyme